jgi:hypothetical protein
MTPAGAQVAGGGRGGGGGGGGFGGGGAARVAPGTYKVTMTANGKTYTSTITVRQDPLLKESSDSGGAMLAIDAQELDPKLDKPKSWPAATGRGGR